MLQEVESIWLNGKFLAWNDAKLHFLTHSLHYGTAVFEGIRCYKTDKGSAVFRLQDHIKRLFASAEIVGMKGLPFTRQQMIGAIKQLIKKNRLSECYIRPMFYYGYGKMGLDTIGAEVEAGIAVWPWGAYLGKEGIEKGVTAMFSSVKRHASKLSHAKVAGLYVNSTVAKMEALNSGYGEAILLDGDGNLAECTGENIFIVKEGKLLTPGADCILVGITRDSIMQIAREQGIAVSEATITKEMLFSAQECFITGTAAEITPIKEVEKKPIGSGKPGPITKKLQKIYDDAIHGREQKWIKWLEFV